MSDSEHEDILFLQFITGMFKIKKKNERERKYWVSQFLSKNEEKGAFNNLTRYETGR